MQAFLFIDLSSAAATTYGQPVLVRLKTTLPEIATLDLDAQSDTLLQQYAVRLLQEAERAVVCIKADSAAAGFGSIMPVLEELLNPHPGRLLLLDGTNQRLLRMLQARPQLNYSAVADEEALHRQLLLHFV